jgi:hypothetical protein
LGPQLLDLFAVQCAWEVCTLFLSEPASPSQLQKVYRPRRTISCSLVVFQHSPSETTFHTDHKESSYQHPLVDDIRSTTDTRQTQWIQNRLRSFWTSSTASTSAWDSFGEAGTDLPFFEDGPVDSDNQKCESNPELRPFFLFIPTLHTQGLETGALSMER